jgi:hypothetical protein
MAKGLAEKRVDAYLAGIIPINFIISSCFKLILLHRGYFPDEYGVKNRYSLQKYKNISYICTELARKSS